MDLTSKFGEAVRQLLTDQYVIWLTTVDSGLTPQPRPVWFLWQDDSFLIYSQATAHKVRHIRQNPKVALHFNTDHTGDKQVIIFTGEATIDEAHLPAHQVAAYLEKYHEGISSLEMTAEEFSREYSTAIKIKPAQVRGWE